jgi:hypothetical protein
MPGNTLKLSATRKMITKENDLYKEPKPLLSVDVSTRVSYLKAIIIYLVIWMTESYFIFPSSV